MGAAGAAVGERGAVGAGQGDAPAGARVRGRGGDDGAGLVGVQQAPGAGLGGRGGQAEQRPGGDQEVDQGRDGGRAAAGGGRGVARRRPGRLVAGRRAAGAARAAGAGAGRADPVSGSRPWVRSVSARARSRSRRPGQPALAQPGGDRVEVGLGGQHVGGVQFPPGQARVAGRLAAGLDPLPVPLGVLPAGLDGLGVELHLQRGGLAGQLLGPQVRRLPRRGPHPPGRRRRGQGCGCTGRSTRPGRRRSARRPSRPASGAAGRSGRSRRRSGARPRPG